MMKMAAAGERKKDERRSIAILSWLTAMLTRSEKLMELEKLQKKLTGEKADFDNSHLSDEEKNKQLAAAVRAAAATFRRVSE